MNGETIGVGDPVILRCEVVTFDHTGRRLDFARGSAGRVIREDKNGADLYVQIGGNTADWIIVNRQQIQREA